MYLVQPEEAFKLSSQIIPFIVGVAASYFFAFTFPGVARAFSAVFVRVFGWVPWRSNLDVSGKWQSIWHVQSSRYPEEVVCEELKLHQLGKKVFGRFKIEGTDFIFLGEIDAQRYLTGSWKDKTKSGYHGAFQLIVDPKNKNMNGTWIGFSTSGIVKNGDWIWKRPD